MSKSFFFGEPIDAQWKRECEEKNKQWNDDWNKRLRKDAMQDVIQSAVLDLDRLEEEDIDTICATLKSLKRNMTVQ